MNTTSNSAEEPVSISNRVREIRWGGAALAFGAVQMTANKPPDSLVLSPQEARQAIKRELKSCELMTSRS